MVVGAYCEGNRNWIGFGEDRIGSGGDRIGFGKVKLDHFDLKRPQMGSD